MLVEANLIVFSNTPFELTDILFDEEPLHTLIIPFKARRGLQSFGAEQNCFITWSLAYHYASNSTFVSSGSHTDPSVLFLPPNTRLHVPTAGSQLAPRSYGHFISATDSSTG